MGHIFPWRELAAAVQAAIALFNETMAEDKHALLGVMRGLAWSRHQAGPTTPGDIEGPGAGLLPL
jgi:hypothetical protein